MPSRREMIRMSDAEVAAYLAGQRRIILATNGDDGMPLPLPMNFAMDDEGRFLISSFRKTRKVRNLERDPRATLLVESGERYHELKSVVAWCRVEIVADPEEVRALMAVMRRGEPLAATMGAEAAAQVEASIAKRVVLRCTPYRLISWDHAKLGDRY
jgi:nitroimidazol reductase NimA-like FMN-containing flavoprotein (pyridoxamine 5'-phosphate oxidase superfamily)